MSRHRLTVVLSQAQGKHPAKRALEESLVAALIMEPGLDVSVVPYLYDLDAEHTAYTIALGRNPRLEAMAAAVAKQATQQLTETGEKVRLFFFDRLREERKFPSVTDLSEQIGRDIQATRDFFASASSRK